MKTPFAVYALFHHDNAERANIYSKLYTLLCRDVDNPFSDGLDIPTYFITSDEDHVIDVTLSDTRKKVYLLFIDINMYCSDTWRQYIDNLMDKKDEHTLVVGIKQYKDAFRLNRKLSEIQSIVIDAEDTQETTLLFEGVNWEHFTTQLYELLIRYVTEKKDKEQLSIFISHSKRDKDNRGVTMANEVRNFLSSNTKLSSFFDVHDILDGYKFGEQIIRRVGNSSLLILFTDTYSSREWCKIETLTAKKKHVPIVAVFMVEDKIDRIFPYIGNIPSTTYKGSGDWRKIINLLLRTTLNQCIETEMLKVVCDANTEFLPYPPEAFSISLLKRETTKLLYPEPPLGNEELDILKNICANMGRSVKFCTPMSYLTENIDLNGKNIAISVSESSDLPTLGISDKMYRDLTIEITRHILKANGKLLYGGNLSKEGYTELFKELSNQYGQQEKTGPDFFYVKNYLSWPLYNSVTIEQKAEYLTSRIQLVNAEVGEFVKSEEIQKFLYPESLGDRLKWASSLTKMRKQMADDSIARVVVGGKTQGFTGYMPGIVEECKIAMDKGQPVFLIGGFGGAARVLVDIIEKKKKASDLRDMALVVEDYKELFEWCGNNQIHIDYEFFDNVTIQHLNNGLSNEDNKKLFYSVDIIEIVSLILKGLNNINI